MKTTILTPLPGTRLFERYQKEKRLLYTDFPSDWAHYDMGEVIHKPGSLEPDQLTQIMGRINNRIHSTPVLFRKALTTFMQTRDFIATMFAWNSNINYRNAGRDQV
jgi:hypothetical protein